MRTDPRKACANGREKFFWAFVHDLFAHGAMALSCWSSWSLKFHDWTSHRAWPRVDESVPVRKEQYFIFAPHISPETNYPIKLQELSPGIWRAYHPNVDHSFTTSAADGFEMYIKARVWFQELSTEFGGRFQI